MERTEISVRRAFVHCSLVAVASALLVAGVVRAEAPPRPVEPGDPPTRCAGAIGCDGGAPEHLVETWLGAMWLDKHLLHIGDTVTLTFQVYDPAFGWRFPGEEFGEKLTSCRNDVDESCTYRVTIGDGWQTGTLTAYAAYASPYNGWAKLDAYMTSPFGTGVAQDYFAVIPDEYRVSGTVLDVAGAPKPGASVTLDLYIGGLVRGHYVVETDAEGRYEGYFRRDWDVKSVEISVANGPDDVGEWKAIGPACTNGYSHLCDAPLDGDVEQSFQELPPVVSKVLRVSIAPLFPFQRSPAFVVAWEGSVENGAVAGFDVSVTSAPFDGPFADPVFWKLDTTKTRARFRGEPGRTYCFAARLRDVDGVYSAWTDYTCTALPIDDASLGGAGWQRLVHAAGSGLYLNTTSEATSKRTRLVKRGLQSRVVALLATQCPTCGSVKVLYNGTPLRLLGTETARVDLSAPTIRRRRLFLFEAAPDTAGLPGTVQVRIVSSGKPVIVDGLAVY